MSDKFENTVNNIENEIKTANEEVTTATAQPQPIVAEPAEQPVVAQAVTPEQPVYVAEESATQEPSAEAEQEAKAEAEAEQGVAVQEQPVAIEQPAPAQEQPVYVQPQAAQQFYQPQQPIYVNPVVGVSPKPAFAPQPYQPPMMYAQPQTYQQQPVYQAPAAGIQSVQSQSTHTDAQPEKVSKESTPKKQKKGLGKAAIAVLIILGFICSGVLGFGGGMMAVKYGSNNGTTKTVNTRVDGDLNIKKVEDNAPDGEVKQKNNLSVAEITDMVADSVVEITTESVVTGRFSQQYIAEGAGSGVIISEDGYIITNNHVIDGAQNISVTLRDGKSYDATIQGKDSIIDIALLKIDAKDLTTAVFGDSDKIHVGDMTVVIGNPLGQLGGTVTDGIVSALNRDIVVEDQTMNLLQTNAAINPGNSGGGLFDGRGNLIGIIVAKSSGTDVEGLGFAIPINDVLDILGDLKTVGYVTGRIEMGMTLLDVTSSQMAWMYGVSDTGVYVYSVTNGSNAAEAGFKSGDYIKTFDGKEVSSSDDIDKILENHKVGDKIEVTVVRRRQTGTLTLELEEYTPNIIGKTESNDGFNNGNSGNNGGNNGGNGDFGGFGGEFFDDFFNKFF